MQAVIDVMMLDNPIPLDKIQEKYVKSITIYTDSED